MSVDSTWQSGCQSADHACVLPADPHNWRLCPYAHEGMLKAATLILLPIATNVRASGSRTWAHSTLPVQHEQQSRPNTPTKHVQHSMCSKLTQPTTIMCAAGEAGRRRPPHMYKAVMCEFAKAVSDQPQAVLCRCHVVIHTSWLIDKVDISSVLVTGCPFHAHGACSCNPYAACLSSLHVRMAHFLHPAASQRTARPSQLSNKRHTREPGRVAAFQANSKGYGTK